VLRATEQEPEKDLAPSLDFSGTGSVPSQRCWTDGGPGKDQETMVDSIGCPQVPLIYDVNTFCQEHRISRAHFYKLVKEGRGPRLIKAGRRTLITAQAAQDWRESLELPGN